MRLFNIDNALNFLRKLGHSVPDTTLDFDAVDFLTRKSVTKLHCQNEDCGTEFEIELLAMAHPMVRIYTQEALLSIFYGKEQERVNMTPHLKEADSLCKRLRHWT